jgi:hypothetical protein
MGRVIHLAVFLVAFACWSVNTLASGGGSLLMVAGLMYVIPAQNVAPVVSLGSLVAGIVRVTVSWRLIEWRVTAWYTPGAVFGAIAGTWLFTRLDQSLSQILVELFLAGSALHFRFGQREQSFAMRAAWFVPVSFVVGAISALVGASGIIALPFYLNYGLMKEQLLATRGQFVATPNRQDRWLCVVWRLATGDRARWADRGRGHRRGHFAGHAVAVAHVRQSVPAVAVLMMFVTGLLILWRHRWRMARSIGVTV